MPFPANFDLANLNGANGFKLSGVAADDESVALLGAATSMATASPT